MNNRAAAVVGLTFLVAVTPSLSDLIQLEDDRPGSWRWVVGWYVVLLVLLVSLWRHIA